MTNMTESDVRLWGVIHYRDTELAFINASIARDAGFHGVALIDMDGRMVSGELIDRARSIKARFADLRVAVNLLRSDGDVCTRMAIEAGLDASWIDDAGVRAGYWRDGIEPKGWIEMIRQVPEHRVFAGVGFKYTSHDSDMLASARTVAASGMTVTTSGPATGKAPSIERLATLSDSLCNQPMAIASGTTPENVATLAEHVTDIFVATGISSSFYTFDEGLAHDTVVALAEPRHA